MVIDSRVYGDKRFITKEGARRKPEDESSSYQIRNACECERSLARSRTNPTAGKCAACCKQKDQRDVSLHGTVPGNQAAWRLLPIIFQSSPAAPKTPCATYLLHGHKRSQTRGSLHKAAAGLGLLTAFFSSRLTRTLKGRQEDSGVVARPKVHPGG